MLGGLGLALPAAALAQPMRGGGMGDAEHRHATDTLRVGSVALMTSRLALSRGSTPKVRQFAKFEVAEQTTIAEIIGDTGMAPPPPDPEGRRMMAMLERARGRQFDQAYVDGQIDGHRKLLAIQERYLAEGRLPPMRHVAMLARGQIKEHLELLEDLRAGRR